jgi:ferric-dicitrate binding protein FerR (iron transport regulator)
MGIENNEEIYSLIAKKMAGSISEEENAKLQLWIESSPENRLYFEQVSNIWDITSSAEEASSINTPLALGNVSDRIHRVSVISRLWHGWQRVAAILILPFIVGGLAYAYLTTHKSNSLNDNVYNEVFAAYGTRSSLRLADSTLVWLNSGSTLKYPIKFKGKNRQVFLKGEAYFEVKCNASKPFIVNTGLLKVTATGTSFNVQEYEQYPQSEITLVQGTVIVSTGSGEKGNSQQLKLNPDQHLVVSKTDNSQFLSDGDTYRYVAWKDGRLMFRNEPLPLVLNKLSILFNVDIELKGDELKNYSYRATFQDESLEEILKLLRLSAPLDYSEVKREPLPDGSFPRKKVIVFPVK